jgi:acyl carrier protein
MGESKADIGEIKAVVKQYILEEFLPGEPEEALSDSLPLISSGIIDSIATAKLILFLEERFKVEFKAHEVSVDYLNCINDIAATVSAKMAG